jgi:predicted RNA-binding protein associated with RNAse of E/G family
VTYARRMGGTNTTGGSGGTDDAIAPFEPGATVAIRELWDGRVWFARPATVVRDDPNLTMLVVHPHATAKEPVDPAGVPLRIPTGDWTLRDIRRGGTWNLSFAFPDTPYAVILGYEATGDLREYYVNLQTPLARSQTGFDLVEHILDVTIPPDRSTWAWKDEDELGEAIDGGLFTEEDAAWFRYWGERAVEHILLREPPFDEDWAAWQPDPTWPEPELPAGWDLVSA